MGSKVRICLATMMALIMLAGGIGGAGATMTEEPVTLRYSLWDSAQAPAYRAILDAFSIERPNVKIEMEFTPNPEYWVKLATQAAANNLPDLHRHQLTRFYDYAKAGQIYPINDYVERDTFDLSPYNPKFIEANTIDGNLYGIPADFDTQAFVYNKDLLKNAGYDEFPDDLSWNAEDGGTFVDFLKQLTLDNKGRNAKDPDFDPTNIKQYGLNSAGRFYDLDRWIAHTVASNGGRLFEPGTNKVVLDEPEAMAAIQFTWKLMNEWHVSPNLDYVVSADANTLFYSQAVAIAGGAPNNTVNYVKNCAFEWDYAKFPKGSSGKSFTRSSSLLDCIATSSANKDVAWELMKYIVTAPGQNILGNMGIVIPANANYTSKFLDYYALQGITNLQLFLDIYYEDTVLPPSFPHYGEATDMARQMFSEVFATGVSWEAAEARLKTFVPEVNAVILQ